MGRPKKERDETTVTAFEMSATDVKRTIRIELEADETRLKLPLILADYGTHPRLETHLKDVIRAAIDRYIQDAEAFIAAKPAAPKPAN